MSVYGSVRCGSGRGMDVGCDSVGCGSGSGVWNVVVVVVSLWECGMSQCIWECGMW